MSADFSQNQNPEIKQIEKKISNCKSFASLKSVPLISFQTFRISKSTSPRNSPIISQLNLLDQLMASAQFPFVTEPKPLMAGHLSVLKAHCRHLAASYGPLNPKSINCAFRYHELFRFIQLLTKYETSFSNALVKRNSDFCSALVINLKRLRTLVYKAIYEHSSHVTKASRSWKSSNPNISNLLDAHSDEIKESDRAVDTIDYDLLFYCGSNTSNRESIDSARKLISNFFSLAFN